MAPMSDAREFRRSLAAFATGVAIVTTTDGNSLAAKTMIERTEERFGLKPERLAADTAYGAAPRPSALVALRMPRPAAGSSMILNGRRQSRPARRKPSRKCSRSPGIPDWKPASDP